MKFNAMVNMECIREGLQSSNADRGGGRLDSFEHQVNEEEEKEHFIVIDENSIYGGRRLSIEAHNEQRRLSEFCPNQQPGKTDEKQAEEDDITLYPFAHQVGGHTQLLTLDRSTLCKPLVPRELLFYLNVPKQLVKFVPAYKGVVQINDNGHHHHQPPVVNHPLRSRKKWPLTSKRTNETKAKAQLTRVKSSEEIDSPSSSPFELRVQLRQFSDEKILKKNLSQENLLRADYISRPNEKYLLLLENVASKYQLPCILDLKMGTRQHGDDASEEKRHRQMAKCQASTSASLGLRLCGMQVYKVDYGGYLWYDKYYGRKMTENDLKQALREYFRLGQLKQLDCLIIDQTIERLKRLHEAIEQSPSFRFYGTSLLIIHESCQVARMNNTDSKNNKTTQEAQPVDVRLIDFAHTICDFSVGQPIGGSKMASNVASGNRASSSPSILNTYSQDRLDFCAPPATIDEQSESNQIESNKINQHPNDIKTLVKDDLEAQKSDHASSENGISLEQPLVGSECMPNDPVLNAAGAELPNGGQRKTSRTSIGPDKGLLFGLENLMRLLGDLKNETLAMNSC